MGSWSLRGLAQMVVCECMRARVCVCVCLCVCVDARCVRCCTYVAAAAGRRHDARMPAGYTAENPSHSRFGAPLFRSCR